MRTAQIDVGVSERTTITEIADLWGVLRRLVRRNAPPPGRANPLAEGIGAAASLRSTGGGTRNLE